MKVPRLRSVLRTSSFLGLQIQERSIRVAEVFSRDRVELVRAGELVLPDGVSLEAPEAAGAALGEFLKRNRFSASHAVAGVPARWLLSREKEVPPLAAGLAGNALRLAAERDFSLEAKDLVLDYAGETDPKEPRRVLLAAMLCEHLERVSRMARAAGLRLDAVTSSTLALSAAAFPGAASGLFVLVTPGAFEVVIRERGVPRLLRHIAVRPGGSGEAGGPASTATPNAASNAASSSGPSGTTSGGPSGGPSGAPSGAPSGTPSGTPSGGPSGAPSAGLLAAAGEARRVIALAAGLGGGERLKEARLWDAIGLEPSAAADLAARIGADAKAFDSPAIPGLESRLQASGDGSRHAVAAALALAGARRELAALDFLHSRCSPPKRTLLRRRVLLGAAALAALLLGGVLLFADLESRAAELETLKSRLAALGPDTQAAQGFSDKVAFVMGWYDARPPLLECLKHVTLAFPEEGSVWVTSISLNETRKGALSGKARDQKSILAVLDRLKGNGKLSDVKLSDMREAGGSSGEVSFALGFNFNGLE